MRQILLVLALILLPARGVAAPPTLSGPGVPVTVGSSFELASAAMGETRRITIALPPGYQTARRYPVVYLLDGGPEQDFVHIAGILQLGAMWGSLEPAILVGLESRDRRRELTDPSADSGEQRDFPTHGQSARFRHFLVEELKPAIEGKYSTSGRSVLMGESLAGYFVVETALRAPGAFTDFVAVSPSLWWNRQTLSREAAGLLAGGLLKSGRPPARLWLSIADEGREMQSAMDRLVAALSAAPGVTLTYHPLPGETHATIYHPAAVLALRELLAPAAP